MTDSQLNEIRKRGWRLEVRDEGRMFKAIFWRGQGLEKRRHEGRGTTLWGAISAAAQSVALGNFLIERGIPL